MECEAFFFSVTAGY